MFDKTFLKMSYLNESIIVFEIFYIKLMQNFLIFQYQCTYHLIGVLVPVTPKKREKRYILTLKFLGS